MAFRQFVASMASLTQFEIALNDINENLSFTIEDEKGSIPCVFEKKEVLGNKCIFYYQVTSPFSFEKQYTVYDNDRNRCILTYGKVVRTKVFDEMFYYDQDDLGPTYSKKMTCFKLWAPISTQVFVLIEQEVYALKKGKKGVWEVCVHKDLEGKSYTYLHHVNNKWVEVCDPYAIAATANSQKSIVVNPQKLLKIHPLQNNVEIQKAVIYEASVRDFSMQENANFKHPGKFLGLIESPTLKGKKLGLSYVKQLGITHIQLMPFYDFGSVDENAPQKVYNWGYDPVLYNVCEGSFVDNPNDAYERIHHLQKVVSTYHENNIGILMDVVYNHVYDTDTFVFEKIVPGYFFRYDENDHKTNGTYCGNDVASERLMVSKFIIDSLKKWILTYDIDGFRFDLMGILDIATIQKAYKELSKLKPSIYMYGEGWQMNTGLNDALCAHQYHAKEMPAIGFFNDAYRNTIKDVLISGTIKDKTLIENLLSGSRQMHFVSPTQSINYIECHDNATAFDFIQQKNPNWSIHDLKRAASFGLQVVLLSQGISFVHSGEEFFRTKDGLDNTYNVSDEINQIDWQRAIQYYEHTQYIARLIAFKKEHTILSLKHYHEIERVCQFHWLTDTVLIYQLKDEHETIAIVFNFGLDDYIFHNEEQWEIYCSYPELSDKYAKEIRMCPQSIAILSENKRYS